jgi:hypothetical protein
LLKFCHPSGVSAFILLLCYNPATLSGFAFS